MDKGSCLVLGAFAFIASCGDPDLEMTGSVHHGDGMPVSGATVRTQCGGDTYGYLLTETAADGTFEASGLGSINRECRLDVIVQGTPNLSYRYRAYDFCADSNGESCTTLKAHIILP